MTDWGLDVQASSYSTDVGAAVAAIVAGHYLLRAFDVGQRREAALVCVLLAAGAITAKASAVLLCGPMILVAAGVESAALVGGISGGGVFDWAVVGEAGDSDGVSAVSDGGVWDAGGLEDAGGEGAVAASDIFGLGAVAEL